MRYRYHFSYKQNLRQQDWSTWELLCLYGVQNNMADIFQTTFLNGFSWMKKVGISNTIWWSLFPRVLLIMIQYWFKYFLAPIRRQAIILTNDGLGWWRIYASICLNELRDKILGMYMQLTIIGSVTMPLTPNILMQWGAVLYDRNRAGWQWYLWMFAGTKPVIPTAYHFQMHAI